MHIYHNREPIVDAPVSTTYFVVEQDEVQTTKLLGPDGQPYAIRRPKAKLGFDLSPNADK